MTATHPSDRELDEFLLGKFPDPDHVAVEAHLAGCPGCQERAADRTAGDTLTELLAAARTRADADRAAAPTPAPAGSATPSLFAPTRVWDDGAPVSVRGDDVPPALVAHPKYRVVRRLGAGGMGTVWLAEHAVMNRLVAIKVIRPDLLAKPGATDRFLREVRAAAKLHHPNIVTAFDAEPAGDSCLLVMEYVPGETLGDRIKAGRLPVAEACRAVRDAARGLAHAHASGLVHRDVKPHNLILAADGTTKVLDFGLAGVVAGEAVAAHGEGLTGTGMVAGTPDYIAPEQAADPHAADARSDVYGLGCTLYHLLAGRPPFPGGSVIEKLAAQKGREPEPIPGLPAGLATVLAKMTAKRPSGRFRSADEVVAPLERCIRAADPKRRNRRRVATAAGLLFAGLLMAVAGVVIKIEYDNQVIEVRTDDPDIEVAMRRKGEVLRVVDRKSEQTWVIDTATNQIARADQPGGLRLTLPKTNEAVVLRRGGKEVFRVTRVPSDRKLIQGVWRGVAAEVGGQSMPPEFINAIKPTLTFTAEKVTGRPAGTFPKAFLEMAAAKGLLPRQAAAIAEKGVEGVYHLDPARSPKTIDLFTLGEPRRTGLGLYLLEGDTLKLCLSIDPERVGDRPKEFATKAGEMRAILTLKRLRGAELPAPKP
jgi:uncharacterized protein (TIGR03067 family)